MIYFGDALKAMDDNGKVGGYLVRFTDASKKDLSGEYFDAKSYLGAHDGDGVDTIFHHGQPLSINAKLSPKAAQEIEGFRDHTFAPVKTKRDAVGIFAETVLSMADEYEKAVFGLVKAGKLGWSSGAVGHLVKKADDGRIIRWPIGEASITPTPCEKLNRAYSIKSLDSLKFVSVIENDEPEAETIPEKPTGLAAKLNQHIDDLADDKGRTREAIINQMAKRAGVEVKAVEAILSNQERPTDARLKAFAAVLNVSYDVLKATTRQDHLQTIKGMFEDALAEQTPSRWELEGIYCKIIKKLANAASAAQMAGVKFDLEAKVAEATTEYTVLLQKHALGQIAEWMDAGGDDDFYLKAIVNPSKDILAGIPALDLSDHSDLLVSGLKSVVSRFRGNHDQRVKAGRVLSEKNRLRLAEFIKQVLAAANGAQSLLDESQPMATASQKRAVLTKHLLRRQAQRELIGV